MTASTAPSATFTRSWSAVSEWARRQRPAMFKGAGDATVPKGGAAEGVKARGVLRYAPMAAVLGGAGEIGRGSARYSRDKPFCVRTGRYCVFILIFIVRINHSRSVFMQVHSFGVGRQRKHAARPT